MSIYAESRQESNTRSLLSNHQVTKITLIDHSNFANMKGLSTCFGPKLARVKAHGAPGEQ